MRQVYDLIRHEWVAATPEEIIRQNWLQRMVQELQFPKECLVVEKELKTLPHLERYPHPLPTRRIDILSFGRGLHPEYPFSPLLLIECKDAPLSQAALEQALSYNTFVQAPYVAIVNQHQVRLRYNLASHVCEINRLPPFRKLIEGLHG